MKTSNISKAKPNKAKTWFRSPFIRHLTGPIQHRAQWVIDEIVLEEAEPWTPLLTL